MIAKGKDCSDLFPAVVKNVVSKDSEVCSLSLLSLPLPPSLSLSPSTSLPLPLPLSHFMLQTQNGCWSLFSHTPHSFYRNTNTHTHTTVYMLFLCLTSHMLLQTYNANTTHIFYCIVYVHTCRVYFSLCIYISYVQSSLLFNL